MTQEVKEIRNIIDAKSRVSTILRQSGIELGVGHGAHMRAGMYSHFYYLDNIGRKHWIKFDKENFMSFGKQFREHNCTIGETIDKEIIDMLSDDDIIYFAKHDRIYFIKVKTIRDSARDRINDTDGAKTLSFPVQLLERLDGDSNGN